MRVRLLLDDIDARAKHARSPVADLHPNIEVRLFNPFYSRSGFCELRGMTLRGSHLNRRMHNKAWIADNRVAIIGGRNIGDEYFGASDQSNFADLDVVLPARSSRQSAGNSTSTGTAATACRCTRFDWRKRQAGLSSPR